MPRIRRLGNRIYTVLINALTSGGITDSASGMRVIRKASLPKLYPLPDGLHFTPAMTARAVSSEGLKLVEVPISYKERVGESKLHVVRDGVRFLRVIMDIILSTRPLRFFFFVAAVAMVVALTLFVRPASYYFAHRKVEDWMIYRLMAVVVLMLTSLSILTVGLVADEIAELVNAEVRRRKRRRLEKFLRALLSQKIMIVAGPLFVLAGLAVNWKGLYQFLAEGRVKVHWVFPVTGAFLVLMGVWSWGLGMLQRHPKASCRMRKRTCRRCWLGSRRSTAGTRRPFDLRSPPVSLRSPKRIRPWCATSCASGWGSRRPCHHHGRRTSGVGATRGICEVSASSDRGAYPRCARHG